MLFNDYFMEKVMNYRKIIIPIFCIFVASCASSPAQLQAISSGNVGCTPSEIVIADYKMGMSTSSWSATCRGKRYVCSGTDMLKGVHCTPTE